jgi:hypothetical protein
MSNLRLLVNQGLDFYHSSSYPNFDIMLVFPRTMEAALESWMLTVCWSHTLSQGGSHWSHGGSP